MGEGVGVGLGGGEGDTVAAENKISFIEIQNYITVLSFKPAVGQN